MSAVPEPHGHSFRHEALLYNGNQEFVAGATTFIRDAVAADEPILVVVSAEKIAMLRENLGSEADHVLFADMSGVGSNPARIIPAWRTFVDEHAGGGRRLRGIGEPIWPDRTPDELIECQRHESLLNLAFSSAQDFWLLCPYDTAALDPAVVDEAHRSHPYLTQGSSQMSSEAYRGLERADAHFDAPLSPAPAGAAELAFESGPLAGIRRFVNQQATAAGLSDAAVADLVLAINEIASNSMRFGGGRGLLRAWSDPRGMVCEVSDAGKLSHPLADRERPTPELDGGRGLWLVNQLCDLVQLRSFPSGTVARVHMHRR